MPTLTVPLPKRRAAAGRSSAARATPVFAFAPAIPAVPRKTRGQLALEDLQRAFGDTFAKLKHVNEYWLAVREEDWERADHLLNGGDL